MPAKVAVIGAGQVGKTLGGKIARTNPVVYGVRDVSKYADLAAANQTVKPVAEAIKDSDVVILTVPGAHDDAGIKSIAKSLGPEVKGKVLLDACNPLGAWPGLESRWTAGTSFGEVLAAELPDTVVYKAFNTVPVEIMAAADGSSIPEVGGPLTLLYAGGPERHELAEEVIRAVGFVPVRVGPIRYARNLESIAEMYVHLSVPGAGLPGVAHWGREWHLQLVGDYPKPNK
ncbi:hypothetical protein CHLRE_14g631600v5 [Chlamydomonas reinhardtii]|uniref:Pyrroline-5-carboxylate reductase catalytic N-terminal domain-containing protein n=1 Tax=Chlamydomonas reinhardtii TaxID=3055 RepID=A8IUR7_CHLRE|nr:uncharacterized protein CHLRE_14g631600v5 [Chlamydomonas reinhardtii]PNW73429.1 hypothetical protein CHLRE_14g631600v5 [Chlamydomonas reinhardtii]|eukprot:XP_001692765.1 predicted protein [Chlamydomonas reinhardtii]